MNNEENKVSIIIPVYNSIKYIRQTLDSIINQKYANWELIIVDDGSNDGSEKVCDEYAKRDKRIRVLHQKNCGVSAARNKGIDNAIGEWIQFLDSDDYVSPYFLKIMLSHSKNVDLVVCSIKNIPTNEIVKFSNKDYLSIEDTKNDFGYLYDKSFFNLPTNKIYKAEKIVCKFPEDMSLGEDLIFNLNFMKGCKGIRTIDEPLFYYRLLSENSLSKLVRRDISDVWKRMIEAINDAFSNDMRITTVVEKRFVQTMVYKYLTLVKNNKYSFFNKIEIMKQWRECELYLYRYANNLPVRFKIAWWMICKKCYFAIFLLGKIYNPT